MNRFVCSVSVLALLSACAAPSQPAVNTPQAFLITPSAATDEPAAVWPSQQWWTGFENDELSALIARAAENNRNLKASVARILQAEASAKAAGAALFPSLSASGSISRAGGDARADTTSTQAGLSASYQVDLFGQVSANTAAAAQRIDSSLYDRETVRITLFSDVATTYLQVLSIRDRLRLAEERLRIAENLLSLVETQRRIGVVSDLELSQQRSAIASQRASIPALKVSERQSLDALAVLLSTLPEEFAVEGRTLATLKLPTIAAGLPASLLERRPDLRKAESDLKANGYDVAAARAARLPSLQLTASGGTASDSLSGLFNSGTFITNLGASLAAPIFQGGRLQANEQAARARRMELVETYQQSVIAAFRDVEDALAAATQTGAQYDFANEAYIQAAEAYRLAELRYRNGAVNFQTVLNAQTAVLSAQETLVSSGLARLSAVVTLTKALGGGWDGATPQRLSLADNLAPLN
ncbi:MAG: efflux transporter outer membrane subunit [Rhodospirillaceae bacterium]|nr:efflux transporter outer membrane subunit [Rhodospirillaceae bacterium]